MLVFKITGWGCNRDDVVFFQIQILTVVVLGLVMCRVLFKSGVAFKQIRPLVIRKYQLVLKKTLS